MYVYIASVGMPRGNRTLVKQRGNKITLEPPDQDRLHVKTELHLRVAQNAINTLNTSYAVRLT